MIEIFSALILYQISNSIFVSWRRRVRNIALLFIFADIKSKLSPCLHHTSCTNDIWNVLCQTMYANIVLPRWDLFIGEPYIRVAFRVGSSAASPHRRVASHRYNHSPRNCSNELTLARKLCATRTRTLHKEGLHRPRSFGVWRQNPAPTSSPPLSFSLSLFMAHFARRKPTPQ